MPNELCAVSKGMTVKPRRIWERPRLKRLVTDEAKNNDGGDPDGGVGS